MSSIFLGEIYEINIFELEWLITVKNIKKYMIIQNKSFVFH